MTDFKKNIKKVTSATSSNWREKANYRKSNRWLEYSSQIARRVLSVLDSRKDLNQTRLAEMLDVSPQQISKIVKGQENLTLETIYKLSNALNVELIQFPSYQWSTMELGNRDSVGEFIGARTLVQAKVFYGGGEALPDSSWSINAVGGEPTPDVNRSQMAAPPMYIAFKASSISQVWAGQKTGS